MKIQIAGILPMSLVNGIGVRYVLFVQGCSHHCIGCQNPDTWDFNAGTEYDTQDLTDLIVSKLSHIKVYDGLTISGGDPFYQQEACVELIHSIRKRIPGLDVCIYTGFEYEEICDTELAALADTLIVGPFIQELKCSNTYYGSSNQRMITKGVST